MKNKLKADQGSFGKGQKTFGGFSRESVEEKTQRELDSLNQNAETSISADAWSCPMCGTRNGLDRKTCIVCGTKKPARSYKWTLIVGCVVVIVGMLIWMIFPNPPVNSESSSDIHTQISSDEGVAEDMPSPAVTVVEELKTSGKSNVGTELRNIEYDSQGNIVSLVEIQNGQWAEWKYVYSKSGSFLFRKQSVAFPNTRWSHSYMPGTDITYIELNSPIPNCVGFSFTYSVPEVASGDGLGDRYVYTSDGDNWTLVGEFSYKSYDAQEVRIELDSPITFAAYATPRKVSDSSHFSVRQPLTEVWVADYDYVYCE